MIASAERIQPASIFARSSLDFAPASRDFVRYCPDFGFGDPILSTNPDTLKFAPGVSVCYHY